MVHWPGCRRCQDPCGWCVPAGSPLLRSEASAFQILAFGSSGASLALLWSKRQCCMTTRCKSLDQLALHQPGLRSVYVGCLPSPRSARAWPSVVWSPTRVRHHMRWSLCPVSQCDSDRAVNSYWPACSAFMWAHICLQRLPAGPFAPVILVNLWLARQPDQIYQPGFGQNPESCLSFFFMEKASWFAHTGLRASCLEMRRPHGPAVTCFCSSQPSAKSAHCSYLVQLRSDLFQQYRFAASSPSRTTAPTIPFAGISSPTHTLLVLASAFHSTCTPS